MRERNSGKSPVFRQQVSIYGKVRPEDTANGDKQGGYFAHCSIVMLVDSVKFARFVTNAFSSLEVTSYAALSSLSRCSSYTLRLLLIIPSISCSHVATINITSPFTMQLQIVSLLAIATAVLAGPFPSPTAHVPAHKSVTHCPATPVPPQICAKSADDLHKCPCTIEGRKVEGICYGGVRLALLELFSCFANEPFDPGMQCIQLLCPREVLIMGLIHLSRCMRATRI